MHVFCLMPIQPRSSSRNQEPSEIDVQVNLSCPEFDNVSNYRHFYKAARLYIEKKKIDLQGQQVGKLYKNFTEWYASQ